MPLTQSPISWTHQPSGSGAPVFPRPTVFPATVETKQDEDDSTEFGDSSDESYGDSAVDLGKYDTVKTSVPNKSNGTPTQLAEFLQQNRSRKDSTSAESTVSLVEEIRKILHEKEEIKTKEIRKIIKEELGQIHTAGSGATTRGGEGHAYQAPVVTQQQNPTPNIRLQPPSGGSTRAPSPRHPRPRSYTNETSASSRPELSPRSTTTGVQWSNTIPSASSPSGSGWTASPTSFTGRYPFETSAVDAKWGQLFDDKGVETKRLGQILNGVGQYILDEFLPQRTPVITPGKLASFYSQHRSSDTEPHPYIDIFRNRSLSQTFYSKLQDLYECLSCEYYLVPSSQSTRPTVPGLTLTGWTRWMTLAIRSYPDEEARRFSNIFSTLPINAVSLLDGKLERLPKQISRHLFPDKPDPATQSLFIRSLDNIRERRPSINISQQQQPVPRPTSPRSRYKPSSSSTGVPSPPSSLTGDEDYTRRDRERRDSYHREKATYESNNSIRRDPPRSGSSRPPSRSSTTSSRTTTGYHQHRHSISGYPAPFGRSVSDATVYTDRERDRERERDRDRDRDREKGRESKSRGRDKESERREKERKRSTSVVSFDRRRGSRRGSVVIKDERDRD